MGENGRNKVRGLVFVIAGIYLIYLAADLVQEIRSETSSAAVKFVAPVLFVVVAIPFIIVGIKTFRKVTEAKNDKEKEEAENAPEDGEAAPIDDKAQADAAPVKAAAKVKDEKEEAPPVRCAKAVLLLSRDIWTDAGVLPAALDEVEDNPQAYYLQQAAFEAGVKKVRYVIGYKNEKVRLALADRGVTFSVQDEKEGSGNALISAKEFIGDDCDVFVFSGNLSSVSSETLENMLKAHRDSENAATILESGTAGGQSPKEDENIYLFRAEDLEEIFALEEESDDKVISVADIFAAMAEKELKIGSYEG